MIVGRKKCVCKNGYAKKENRVSRHDSLRLIVKCIQGCDYIVKF